MKLMTIEEVENLLPNGFHDAYIGRIDVDFRKQTALLELAVDYGNEIGTAYRDVCLTLRKVSLVIVESADAVPFLAEGGSVAASGCETTEKILPSLESYRRNAPVGSFFYSFFLHDWNSFLHIAAVEAELVPNATSPLPSL